MQFLSVWQTQSTSAFIIFRSPVLETFARYRQLRHNDKEAGGILLGCVRGAHLEISNATEPHAQDFRAIMRFDRSQVGHQEIADTLWQESNGTVRYLGEWHSHPEDFPSPSSTDLDGWKRRAAVRRDHRATLGVIVGRKSLYAAFVDSRGVVERLEGCLVG